MGISATTLAYVSAGTAVAGAYMQYEAGQRAQEASARSSAEQRKQYESQQRIADIKNARERASIARQGRINRGNLEALGVNTNTTGSSGIAGGLSSVGTQAAGNLGEFGALQSNQGAILQSQGRQGAANADMTSAQADISSSQALFGLGKEAFKEAGGFKTIFDTTPKQQSVPQYNPAYVDMGV